MTLIFIIDNKVGDDILNILQIETEAKKKKTACS